MPIKTRLLSLLSFFFCLTVQAQQNTLPDSSLLAPGAKPILVSKQFRFTEGPTPDKKGNIYFTDQPNNTIWKYDTEGKLSLFMDSAGRSNGLYIDKKGRLLSCADEQNQLWSIGPDKKITILLNDLDGKKLNGPNDLWVSPRGDIYFTDPYYQRPWWKRTQPEIVGEKVYVLKRGGKTPIAVVDTLQKPNGIVGTPDGNYLYVADIKGNKTYKYTINKDGSLQNAQLFANLGSDGMTLDKHGNLYLTGNGVTVFNANGQQILHITIPEKWTANVAFGGKHRNQLFVTASEAVYVVEMAVKGVE